MSLFGFARDIGRRIFNKDEDAAEKIKELIEADNPGVKNLEVTFDQGIVGLCGTCDSVEAVQKAVLIAGNVEGVKDVYASKLNYPRPPAGKATSKEAVEKAIQKQIEEDIATGTDFYTIVSGDTLSKIAKRVYGDAKAYTKIFEANREVIKDPDKIFVGQKIRIPKA